MARDVFQYPQPRDTHSHVFRGSRLVGYRISMALAIAIATACSSSVFAQGVETESVTDISTIRQVTSLLERHLRQYGISATLHECSHVKALRAGKDLSYGAICEMSTVSKTAKILICDDRLVGRMTTRFSGFVISDESVERFVKQNCPAGG